MIDWIKSKLKGEKHLCLECNKYIANERMNDIIENSNLWCEGGGFCCPIKGVAYFIGVNKYDTFCHKFKFRGDEKLKEKFMQLRAKHKENKS